MAQAVGGNGMFGNIITCSLSEACVHLYIGKLYEKVKN